MFCHLFPLMLSALLIGWAAPAPPTKPPTPEFLLAKLDSTIDFEGAHDPRLTLTQFLDDLTKKTGVPFLVNQRAFQAEGLADVLQTAIAEKRIPPAKDIRLERLLRRVLERIPVPSGASFVLRRDGIEITTTQVAYAQARGTGGGPRLPLVHVLAEKRPLDAVLKDLAEQAEYNIVLDKRAAAQAKTEVTARLLNAPLDTAVALLADMAELDHFIRDNVVYVTTPEHAQHWRVRLKPAPEQLGDPNYFGPRIGPGVGGPSMFSPGLGGLGGFGSLPTGNPGGAGGDRPGALIGAALGAIGGAVIGDSPQPPASAERKERPSKEKSKQPLSDKESK